MQNNQLQLIWSVLCSQSTIDMETKNLSLLNVIEKLTFTIPSSEIKKSKESGAKGILVPASFEITSLFRNTDTSRAGVYDIKIVMKNTEGEYMTETEGQRVDLKEGIRSIRIRNRFNDIPVEKNGDYLFVIQSKTNEEKDFVEIGSVPVILEVVEDSEEIKRN